MHRGMQESVSALEADGALSQQQAVDLKQHMDAIGSRLDEDNIPAAQRCFEDPPNALNDLHLSGQEALDVIGPLLFCMSSVQRVPVGWLDDGRVLLLEESGSFEDFVEGRQFSTRLVAQSPGGEQTEFICDLPQNISEMHWTGDLSHIAFKHQIHQTDQRPGERPVASFRYVLTIRTIATGDETDLGEGWRPLWSPDGKWLLYTVRSAAYGDEHLYRTDPSGSDRTLIADVIWDFDWAPDSRWVAYSVAGSARSP